MHILLTGGSGDVGTLLTRDLLAQGHEVTNIDMAMPKISGGTFIQGSILDRNLLAHVMKDVDCVIHIAAWHGIHEKTKSPADFHDLNVTGTFNTLQAAADAGVKKFIFISSTSVDDATGIYGHTKLLGEDMVRTYAERYPNMTCLTLRPRAFIPSWNRQVYKKFTEWAAWFMKGAVHIDDFKEAILIAVSLSPVTKSPIYVIDGAYDYSRKDLDDWKGSETFAKYYSDAIPLAHQYGLDTARKPKMLDIPEDMRLPGYVPRYSMRNLLDEFKLYGENGPPPPWNTAPTTKATNVTYKPDI